MYLFVIHLCKIKDAMIKKSHLFNDPIDLQHFRIARVIHSQEIKHPLVHPHKIARSRERVVG